MKLLLLVLCFLISTQAFAVEKSKAQDVKWNLKVIKGQEAKLLKEYTIGKNPISLELPGSKWVCSTQLGEQDGMSAVAIICKAGDLAVVLPGICGLSGQGYAMNIASSGQIYTFQLTCEK